MSHRVERTGRRTADRLFSEWHGEWLPLHAGLIDLDFVGYCRKCSKPLVLVETAIATGEAKPSTVTRKLAQAARIEAFVLLIRPDDEDRQIRDAWLQQIAPSEGPLRRITGEQLRDDLLEARRRAAIVVGCPHEATR